MKQINDFMKFALSHAKRASVPKTTASLLIPPDEVGKGGEWEYMWGTMGEVITQSILDRRWESHYKTTNWSREQYLKATDGWVKRKQRAADCQGLLDAYLGNDTNANGNYTKYCTNKGKIKDIGRPFVIGEALFNGTETKKTHVGWVCGFATDGQPLVVHARGLAHGVVITTMQEFKWSYRGLMKNIFNYTTQEEVMKKIEIKQPLMRGNDIKALQTALNMLGYKAGTEDGIAGENTVKAIEQFALAHSKATASLPDKINVSVSVGNTVYNGVIKR